MMTRILKVSFLVSLLALCAESAGQSGFSLPLKMLHVNQGFGWRIHPLTKAPDFHNGIDLKADFQPVFSIADGQVINANSNAVSGNFIVISHGKLLSHYAHLSRVLVSRQDSVFRGQLIGLSGNSGRTTGPHLHFALSFSGIELDALKFLYALAPSDAVSADFAKPDKSH